MSTEQAQDVVLLSNTLIDRFIKSGRAKEVFPAFKEEQARNSVKRAEDKNCPPCVIRALNLFRGAVLRGLVALHNKGDSASLEKIARFKEIVGVAGKKLKLVTIYNGRRVEVIV